MNYFTFYAYDLNLPNNKVISIGSRDYREYHNMAYEYLRDNELNHVVRRTVIYIKKTGMIQRIICDTYKRTPGLADR